jgi:uncharacterized membrane protein YuzA (DUF378 family)
MTTSRRFAAAAQCLLCGPYQLPEIIMKWLNIVTLALIIVGGLNWGLVAIGGYEMDLVASLFGGADSGASRFVYALVGLSALWQLVPWGRTFSIGESMAEASRPSSIRS